MRWMILTGSLLLMMGCSDTAKTSKPSASPSSAASAKSPLEPLLMAQKPNSAISVTEAMNRKAGETIIVTGQVPPVKVQPFNPAVAAFVMLSHESLAREEVKEEFDCDDAATCPSCRKLLDSLGVRVELVDQSGVIVPASLEGFQNLKPGSTITVEGELKRDGKDNKLVRIIAKKFYPG